jgi:uncharacterized membrane protein
MAVLILGLLVFLGAHSTRIFAEDWRGRQIGRLGENGWKAAYSIISLVGFAILVYGYGGARSAPVVWWTPPRWTAHLTALLVLVSFILIACAYVPGTRIKAAVGHPMVLGVKTWALAHLLSNGTAHDVVLFGAFLVWAVADYAASRRRDRASGTRYPAGPVTRDAVAIAAGAIAWAVFAFALHGWLIGVRPLG